MMIWHILSSEQDTHRPGHRTAMKLRKVEFKAGAVSTYGKAGSVHDYWIKEICDREARRMRRKSLHMHKKPSQTVRREAMSGL